MYNNKFNSQKKDGYPDDLLYPRPIPAEKKMRRKGKRGKR